MALELLNYLPILQVPDVDRFVLRPADNPLATGHGEVREDAVLRVGVARVGLQALALIEVPQLESAEVHGGYTTGLHISPEILQPVQRSGQDVFPVRRELHV